MWKHRRQTCRRRFAGYRPNTADARCTFLEVDPQCVPHGPGIDTGVEHLDALPSLPRPELDDSTVAYIPNNAPLTDKLVEKLLA
jgi:hypothetical protein